MLWELQENIRFSNEIFFPLVGSYSSNYSPRSMVTPSISGLFSVDALQFVLYKIARSITILFRALYDSGIRNVVGDNSVKALVPDFPYHGITTTKEVNGLDGIFIIPRQATSIT